MVHCIQYLHYIQAKFRAELSLNYDPALAVVYGELEDSELPPRVLLRVAL